MGDWDVPCAVCGGTTGWGDIILRSHGPEAVKRRHQGQQGEGEGEGEGEDMDIGYDSDLVNIPDEDEGYDADLVAKDLSWLRSVRCLGLNPDAPGVTK
jgi:hypothetical protein